MKNLTDSGLDCSILVAPGAVPLHLTPGVSDPDQLDSPTSVTHLKSDLKTNFYSFFSHSIVFMMASEKTGTQRHSDFNLSRLR